MKIKTSDLYFTALLAVSALAVCSISHNDRFAEKIANAQARGTPNGETSPSQNFEDLADAGYRQYGEPFDRDMYQLELRSRAWMKNHPGDFETLLTAGIAVTGVATAAMMRRKLRVQPRP